MQTLRKSRGWALDDLVIEENEGRGIGLLRLVVGWAVTPGLREALNRGAATVHEGQVPGDSDLREWMVVHVPIPQIGWVATAWIPVAEAMGESRRALYGEVAIQVVLVILFACAALILADRVSRPAHRLADAAQRIAGARQDGACRPYGAE